MFRRVLVAAVCSLPIACGRGSQPPQNGNGAPADSVKPVAAAPATASPTSSSASTDSLVRAFRRAHAQRDVPALLALFESKCAPEKIRALTEQTLRSHLDDPIQAARVEPPMASRLTSYVRDGTRWELNVPLDGELVIVYDTLTGRRSSYPVGSVDGIARLGTMCPR